MHNPTQAVHGLPITPRALLEQLRGASFCVSYWNEAPQNPRAAKGRAQVDDAVRLVGPDGIVILDNGAFSAWTSGVQLTDAHWGGFWSWAVPILERCPQAVAVVPDVIGGQLADNIRQIQELPDELWGLEHRLMVIWHLDEPLDHLRWMVESGFGFIGFGSCGAYAQVGSSAWDARVDEAFAVIDELTADPTAYGLARPRIHMMRGLGQLKRGRHPFQTADSTNVARNHNRHKGTPSHVACFRARVEAGRFPDAPAPLWPLSTRDARSWCSPAEAARMNDDAVAGLRRLMAEIRTEPHAAYGIAAE